MSDIVVEPPGSHEPQGVKTPRKAAISSWIGSALEYYDFFIYGTAASLIFPKLFFPAGNPTAATIASLATFGVAYVARPIGSFIMGHLGDTIGRKRVLTITLFGMGARDLRDRILPTYDQIGIAAAILLLICRILSGPGRSGEQSSASSTTLEHAPANAGACSPASPLRAPRAATSWPASRSWSWRRSRRTAVLLGLADPVPAQRGGGGRRLVDPATLHESPAFEEEQEHKEVPKAPLKVLFKSTPRKCC